MDFVNIQKLFSSDYYSVPDYQRDYEWTVAQNSTLFDDIVSIMTDTDKSRKHFIGAIVTVPYEKSNGINKSFDLEEYSISESEVKHVVDGQQRLTSLSLLISATRDALLSDDKIKKEIRENLGNILLGLLIGKRFRNIDFNKAPYLILNGNTGRCYNKDILHARSDSANKVFRGAKRIITTYNYYIDQIKKTCVECIADHYFGNEQEFYTALIDVITSRLILVEITCDASSNAFQVFDSLNGKGLDLTAADRIKNIMLSWASSNDKAAQKWDALVELTTEDYLANYFITLFFYNCKERISKNKLPDKFKETYQQSAKSNFSSFFDTLKETANLYGCLRLCKTPNKRLNELLKDLCQLNLDQVYVLLFSVALHYKNDDILNKKEYMDFVKSLTALLVRMQISEMSMNKLDLLFKACIKEMREANSDISVIIHKIDEAKRNISDAIFKEKFKQFSTTDNKLSEFYLRHLENYRRNKAGDRTKVERDLTVEHIIPQTLADLSEWYGDATIPPEIEEDFKMGVQQNIGNKALLYGDDNSSAGNNDYKTKLNVYNTGKKNQDQGTPIETFQLIRDLVNNYPTVFNHEEVANRAEELATYAIEIW